MNCPSVRSEAIPGSGVERKHRDAAAVDEPTERRIVSAGDPQRITFWRSVATPVLRRASRAVDGATGSRGACLFSDKHSA